MSALRALGSSLLRLLYPANAVCMGCGSAAGFRRDWLCDECRRTLASLWIGAAPVPEVTGIQGAAFAYRYAGPTKGIVRRLKYHGVRGLVDGMADDMARAFRAIEPTGVELVVPVPMHLRRERRRGGNHAELLARAVAERLGIPEASALVRVRNTRQQARLSRAERLRNLEGAFTCPGDVAGRRVLLVDDVCTTGTTAQCCVDALLEAGAEAVFLLCFGRALKPARQ